MDAYLLLNEEETRFALIDPVLRARGWDILKGTMRLERTPGYIYRHEGEWDHGNGRLDYLLCLRPSPNDAPLPVAVIEAKKAGSTPDLGLGQAKWYADRFSVPFVFSTNGSRFVTYNDVAKITGAARPMADFPSHDEMVLLYQTANSFVGFQIELMP